jgi:hypothetical protein
MDNLSIGRRRKTKILERSPLLSPNMRRHMDVVEHLVQYSGIALAVAMPVIFAIRGIYTRNGAKLITNLFVSTVLVIVVATFIAYWPHMYRNIRLDMLGVDTSGTSDAERIRNVAPEHRTEAVRRYWSLMGVGWPITAFALAVIGLMYQFAVWVVLYAFKRLLAVIRGPYKDGVRPK